MTEEILIFSIASLSVWDIFNWQLFAVFYCFALVLWLFPTAAGSRPIVRIAFLSSHPKRNAIGLFIFVSIISVPHFAITYYAYENDRDALFNGSYTEYEGIYEQYRPQDNDEFLSERQAVW